MNKKNEFNRKRIRTAFIILLCMMSHLPAHPQSAVPEPPAETRREKGIEQAEGTETEKKKDGKRYAILIGINEYESKYWNALKKARNDAEQVGIKLKDLGKFNVTIMTDRPELKGSRLFPSRENIINRISEKIQTLSPEDTLLIFFSGHGFSNRNDDNFLVAQDADRDEENKSVSVNFIQEEIKKKYIKKSLIILDACRNAAVSGKGDPKNGSFDDVLAQKKFSDANIGAVYFSTSQNKMSYEHPDSEFGVFTHFMLKALEGKDEIIDKDRNGGVSFGELVDYVGSAIEEYSKNLTEKEKQMPRTDRYMKEEYGDILLTERKDSGRSVVDRTGKRQYIFRSLVPGWGQIHDGRKEMGFGYMTAGGLLLGNFLVSYQGLQKAKNDYNSTIAIPANSITGNTLLYNYVNFGEKRDRYASATDRTNLAIGLFSVFYFLNLFDAYYYSGKLPEVDPAKEFEPEKTSFYWDIKSYRSNMIGRSEQNFEMNFNWSF